MIPDGVKKEMEQEIKCYHFKTKNENCYTFILRNEFRISYRIKAGKSSLLMTDVESISELSKANNEKEIPYRFGIKKAIAMATKKKNATLFPIQGYLFIQAITDEFSKLKQRRPEKINCKGG